MKRLIPNITEKMLTEKLRELEADGLVHREVYREVPPKVEYRLTPYGKKLNGLLDQLCRWGEHHARKHHIRIGDPLRETINSRITRFVSDRA